MTEGKRFSWEKASFNEQYVINLIEKDAGLTDRKVAEKLGLSVKTIKAICSQLVYKGKIDRVKVKGAEIKNYVIGPEIGCLSINRAADLEQMVLNVLSKDKGLTEREITEKINREGIYEFVVYEVCRQLEYKGKIKRVKGDQIEYFLI